MGKTKAKRRSKSGADNITTAQISTIYNCLVQSDYHNIERDFLRAMLEKGRKTKENGSTLIVGDSQAVYGIEEKYWKNAVNCSVECQDIYYDYLCARYVLDKAKPGVFKRCIIVCGYYAPFQDVSLSKANAWPMINYIYYPIFQDLRNWDGKKPEDYWDTPKVTEAWEAIAHRKEPIPNAVRKAVEKAITKHFIEQGTVFAVMNRGVTAYAGGRRWVQFTQEEKYRYSNEMAQRWNTFDKYSETRRENGAILEAFIQYLITKDVTPCFVIGPLTKTIRELLDPKVKEALGEWLDSIPEVIDYVDFNESDLFEDIDFMDMNHLSPYGAEKFSKMLVDLFGE